MKDLRLKIVLERENLAYLSEHLNDSSLERAGILPYWSVKDIIAHIVLETRYTLMGSLVGMVRYGSINRYMRWAAKNYSAKRTIQELIDELIANKDNFRSPPGIKLEEVYIDLVLHRQDILLSLNREHDLTIAEAEDILAYLPYLSFTGQIVLKKALRHLRDYSFKFPDGTSLGQGKRLMNTSKPRAILILLERITP